MAGLEDEDVKQRNISILTPASHGSQLYEEWPRGEQCPIWYPAFMCENNTEESISAHFNKIPAIGSLVFSIYANLSDTFIINWVYDYILIECNKLASLKALVYPPTGPVLDNY